MNDENRTIVTKYGKARIGKNGYYMITSSKEGNYKKYLHRLIWEDHYGKPVPKGYDIHHINDDKLDNRIQNLQCVEHGLHIRFHHKDKIVSEETRRKISKKRKGIKFSKEHKRKLSEAKNTTGYYRVYKHKDKYYKQGFRWCYQYRKNGKPKIISRVNLDDLEKEVKNRDLLWIKLGG